MWAPNGVISSPISFSGESPQVEGSDPHYMFKTSDLKSETQYTNHAPILIENNTDFNTQAQNEGWIGSGSQEDPIIISGLEIKNSSTSLITIKNTDFCFQLDNNILDGVITDPDKRRVKGIIFSNVSHASITDNIIKNTQYGINIIKSFNISIRNNTISSFNHKGVYVTQSLNNTVSQNKISDNDHGTPPTNWEAYSSIHILGSHNNCIFNNELTKYWNIGINLDASLDNYVARNNITGSRSVDIGIAVYSSQNNTIENNLLTTCGTGYHEFVNANYNNISYNIFRNNVVGTWLWGESIFSRNNVSGSEECAIELGWFPEKIKTVGTIVKQNIVFSNKRGIILSYAEEISILNNSIYSNTLHGINISAVSKNNIIKWNDFLDNNLGGDSQALDTGIDNTFTSNYWYEWTKPDSDEDGIVDKPYPIEGEADNTDPTPLASLNNLASPTDITAPPKKSTPGWTLVVLLPQIIVIALIRAVRKGKLKGK
jgi:parallel beta-helix repeat protein